MTQLMKSQSTNIGSYRCDAKVSKMKNNLNG